MLFLIKGLIFSLPFADFPRLGPIRLYDLFFICLIFGYFLCDRRVDVYKQAVLLTLIFLGFAAYGYFHINYFYPIHIKGEWGHKGWESPATYSVLISVRTVVYIFGANILAKYAAKYHREVFGFIYNWFIAYGIFIFTFALIPVTRARFFGRGFLSGTFSERGPLSIYVVFVFCLLITCNMLSGRRFLSKAKLAVLYGMTFAMLGASAGSRGVMVMLIFLVANFFFANPALVFKSLMVTGVSVVGFLPFVAKMVLLTINKIIVLVRFTNSNLVPLFKANAVGRYASMILFPDIFKDFLWMGIGYGNYIFYRISDEYANGMFVVPHDNAENFYLGALMECGVVGFSLISFFVVIGPFGKIVKQNKTKLVGFFVAFVAHLLFQEPSFYQTWVWFFLLLAFIHVDEDEWFNQPRAVAIQ